MATTFEKLNLKQELAVSREIVEPIWVQPEAIV
jgi:hypothetical protein